MDFLIHSELKNYFNFLVLTSTVNILRSKYGEWRNDVCRYITWREGWAGLGMKILQPFLNAKYAKFGGLLISQASMYQDLSNCTH